MLNKLAFRNAKRSLNDYLLYFITMALITALMYSFNSLLFSKSIQTLWKSGGFYAAMLILVTIFIVFIIIWLVHYMVCFMARKRSREFGTYLLMGVRKKQIARLFMRENILIGAVAFLVGMIPGILLQQVLMKLIYVIVDEIYFVHFEPSLEPIFVTILVYGFAYLLALIGNGRQFRKMNIADMLRQEQKNEEMLNSNNTKTCGLFVIGVIYLVTFVVVVSLLELTIGGVLLLIIGLVFAIYFIYVGLSAFFIKYIRKGNQRIWKNGNLFVLRQISSKIKTMRFTLGTLTVLFIITLVGGSCAMMLNAFQSTQANEKWPFDISVFSSDIGDDFLEERAIIDDEIVNPQYYRYNVYEVGTTQMTDFLMSNVSGANEYSYFPNDTFMKLSDYNELRKMLGYEQVTLEKGKYLIHIKGRMKQNAERFVRMCDLHIAREDLSCGGIYTEGFGQNRHNGADYMFVVQDEVVNSMKPYYSVLAVNFIGGFSERGYELLNTIQVEKSNSDDMLNSYGIGTDRIAVNISNVYVKKYDTRWMKSTLSAAIFPLIYIGMVCICVALTILSVQQLSDIGKQRRSYLILKKMGMNSITINKVIFKQISVYFLVPYVVSIIISIGIDSFISKNFAYFSGVMLPHWIYLGISLVIFSVIYLIYYLITYFQLKKNLTDRRKIREC